MQKEKIELFDQYFKEYISRGIAGGAVLKNWNYKDDLIVIGSYDMFIATGDLEYRDAIVGFAEHLLSTNGEIKGYNLDSISAAKTDLILKQLTGSMKYQERMLQKLDNLKTHPRTKSGNFWHKDIYPNQVWLDGLYMCMPVYLQDLNNSEDAMQQFENVRKYLYDATLKLYFHAWSEDKKQEWADPNTGLSPCVWLRADGWFLMALVDCFVLMQNDAYKKRLAELLREAFDGILMYQDEKTKMFYQLVDQKDLEKNYLEVSGSAMIAYSLMKGARTGMLPKENWEKGADILHGIADTYLNVQNGRLMLEGICASAGLGPGPDNRTDRDGSKEYYLSEAVCPDNQHGTGACMMAYSEYVLGKE